ncbi:MAG: mandelate racemase/muconate lactonizing enzyme family protein [Pseudomonadota bacterium]|nr:mandelate racemase/muconate lactonizing enzyme family protein [Pseudomonadota bacterium]
MKITRVEATPLYIELNIDILGINKTNGLSLVLVEVETDGGLLGHGITAIMDEDVVASAVNDLAGPTIIGENPMANERIWEKLYWQLTPRGQTGYGGHAIAAIDVALWDIKGKFLEQPLWKLLGGHRDRVPTYASGALRRGLTDDQTQQAAQTLLDKGFREMKTQMALPGNPSPEDELRRIRVIRDVIGPDIKLMCDINQRWRPEQAINIGSRAEDVGLFWLEDVTTADDYAGLARVTAALNTPIAGGEYLWGIAPFRQMIEARSVDIVMVDIVRAGGATQWMKIAGMAEAFNLPIVSHVMPEILVHVVAACPNGLTVEYMPWMLCLYEETPAVENGEMVLPDKPGLGLKFDEAAISSYKA